MYYNKNKEKFFMEEIIEFSQFSPEAILEMLTLTPAQLTDAGICPTCLNRFTNNAVYGDDKYLKFYEDSDIECLFESRPRAAGHMLISTKKHYHDKSEAPAKLNEKISRFEAELMRIIKKVYGCERVYGCTMCDGPANHYHTQLIPRYANEKRGSDNFVKSRTPYVYDADKFKQVSKIIYDYAKKYEGITNEPIQMD